LKVLRLTPQLGQAFGRSKPSFVKLNETGTVVSDWVHVREIVVIPDIAGLPDHAGMSPDRLPFACRVDISAATPLSAFQGRDHGD
jgi:hypothetical protein